VLTRLDLYQDLLAFGPQAKVGKVYKPSKGLPPPVGHAVLLIGYNNVEQYWTAKNSFGPSWGDAGTFKVGSGSGFVGFEGVHATVTVLRVCMQAAAVR
jgi:hypothetical protein